MATSNTASSNPGRRSPSYVRRWGLIRSCCLWMPSGSFGAPTRCMIILQHAPSGMTVGILCARLAKSLWRSYGIETPEYNAPSALWRLCKAMGGTRESSFLCSMHVHVSLVSRMERPSSVRCATSFADRARRIGNRRCLAHVSYFNSVCLVCSSQTEVFHTQGANGVNVAMIYRMAKRVGSVVSVPLNLYTATGFVPPGERRSARAYDSYPPEVGLTACIVIVLKLVYGLDGQDRCAKSLTTRSGNSSADCRAECQRRTTMWRARCRQRRICSVQCSSRRAGRPAI